MASGYLPPLCCSYILPCTAKSHTFCHARGHKPVPDLWPRGCMYPGCCLSQHKLSPLSHSAAQTTLGNPAGSCLSAMHLSPLFRLQKLGTNQRCSNSLEVEDPHVAYCKLIPRHPQVLPSPNRKASLLTRVKPCLACKAQRPLKFSQAPPH